MKDQEYVIKGTIEGMMKVLQSDFDMPAPEARFFIYSMLDHHSKDAVNTINKSELDMWYLEPDRERYMGQILQTNLVITFTAIKKELYHYAYKFFVKYLFPRKIDLVLIGADLVFLVASAIEKIDNADYCIYSRIIELCIGNRDRLFSENEIVTANRDGKCDYQDEDRRCPYLGCDDNCTCNEAKVRLAFHNLSEKNIIKAVGERWILVR